MMADGWAHDGAVQEQIEDTVADAVKIARSRIASGEGTRFCEDCGMEITAARRKAMPSSRTSVSCQDKRDASIRPAGSNRRGTPEVGRGACRGKVVEEGENRVVAGQLKTKKNRERN